MFNVVIYNVFVRKVNENFCDFIMTQSEIAAVVICPK